MAKSKKAIVPFFTLRWQVQDTLEAIANEILMTIQTLETTIELGGLNEPSKKILQERLDSWRGLCMEPDSAE